MAWKNLQQRSLAEGLLIEHDAIKELDDVQALIDWSRLEALLSGIHSSKMGEKAWPPIMMFKALLLQVWYKLSDPGLEKQLARDLLFRRFVGLDISESVPDHSSLWRFRQQLEKRSLMDSLLAEITKQLKEKGLYIQFGEISIVDASVIEAKQCRPNKGKDGKSTQDPEAAWNVKTGSDGKRKNTYGFKAHVNVEEDGFIKSSDFTAGNVHDSQRFIELLTETESTVYADSAYRSEEHDQWLAHRGIKNCINKRAYRNRPLSENARIFNQICSSVRNTVERVFGILKQHYGMAKARYLGLDRNRTRFELMCIAYNMKRGISVQQESCV
jgi:transposase, IS5 family